MADILVTHILKRVFLAAHHFGQPANDFLGGDLLHSVRVPLDHRIQVVLLEMLFQPLTGPDLRWENIDQTELVKSSFTEQGCKVFNRLRRGGRKVEADKVGQKVESDLILDDCISPER